MGEKRTKNCETKNEEKREREGERERGGEREREKEGEREREREREGERDGGGEEERERERASLATHGPVDPGGGGGYGFTLPRGYMAKWELHENNVYPVRSSQTFTRERLAPLWIYGGAKLTSALCVTLNPGQTTLSGSLKNCTSRGSKTFGFLYSFFFLNAFPHNSVLSHRTPSMPIHELGFIQKNSELILYYVLHRCGKFWTERSLKKNIWLFSKRIFFICNLASCGVFFTGYCKNIFKISCFVRNLVFYNAVKNNSGNLEVENFCISKWYKRRIISWKF